MSTPNLFPIPVRRMPVSDFRSRLQAAALDPCNDPQAVRQACHAVIRQMTAEDCLAVASDLQDTMQESLFDKACKVLALAGCVKPYDWRPIGGDADQLELVHRIHDFDAIEDWCKLNPLQ